MRSASSTIIIQIIDDVRENVYLYITNLKFRWMHNDNIIQGNIKLNNQAITITPRILILSNSSSGLYEFRNEVVEDLLRDQEIYISLPDEDTYTNSLSD